MGQRNKNIEPGWKMTTAQIYGRGENGKQPGYFEMFKQVCRALDWKGNAEQMTAFRREFHVMSGLGPVSAKTINRLEGFDALKKTWLAVTQPANLNEQMKMEQMPRHRLITRIRSMAPEAYWSKIARDKYGTDDLDGLNDKELTDLRNTCEARMAKPKTKMECPF